MSSQVEMVPVESKAIHSVGYDPDSATLHVKFHSGATYHYPGVTPEQHQALLQSDSKGRHFQQHIRGKFDHKRAA